MTLRIFLHLMFIRFSIFCTFIYVSMRTLILSITGNERILQKMFEDNGVNKNYFLEDQELMNLSFT